MMGGTVCAGVNDGDASNDAHHILEITFVVVDQLSGLSVVRLRAPSPGVNIHLAV